MHCPVFTSYTYNGDLLVCEKNGTDTIWYTYDENGSPIGIELNGTQYYYVKNVQGDIVGIVDTSGNKVVEYNYNSWGYLRYTTGSMASTLGAKNHLRYRGYYYDTDMGLYYLMSRYYDPRTGRFINADDTAYIGADGSFASYSLFTYCGNNPVMNVDPSGYITIGPILRINNNYSYNSKFTFSSYIFGQGYGNQSKLKFGAYKGSYNGCGWIASYNATIMLGKRIQPAKIIRYFECYTPVLKGKFGVYPSAIVNFFRSLRYKVTLTYDFKNADKVAKKNKANIVLFMHNQGMHYVSFRWINSAFRAYNMFSSDRGYREYSSVSKLLNAGGGIGVVLISIS